MCLQEGYWSPFRTMTKAILHRRPPAFEQGYEIGADGDGEDLGPNGEAEEHGGDVPSGTSPDKRVAALTDDLTNQSDDRLQGWTSAAAHCFHWPLPTSCDLRLRCHPALCC